MQLDISVGAAILLLGLVVIAVFYHPIHKKILDIRSAGKDGVSFMPDTQNAQEQAASTPPVEATSVNRTLAETPVMREVLEREKGIREALAQVKNEPEAEKIKLLMRALAASLVNDNFRLIASLIFGSQVELLVHMASSRAATSEIEAKEFYEKASKDFPDMYRERTYEDWRTYIERVGFIQVTDTSLVLTSRGEDFLKFLVEQRIAHRRAG